jgi:2-oxoglutarate dehydrogenase complex dehydrogenase (E1) component-like enzyme
VSLNEFDDFLKERKEKYNEDITPWFKLIKDNKLQSWWQNLIEKNEFPHEAHYIEKFV